MERLDKLKELKTILEEYTHGFFEIEFFSFQLLIRDDFCISMTMDNEIFEVSDTTIYGELYFKMKFQDLVNFLKSFIDGVRKTEFIIPGDYYATFQEYMIKNFNKDINEFTNVYGVDLRRKVNDEQLFYISKCFDVEYNYLKKVQDYYINIQPDSKITANI